jgi:hypothetical protein
LELHELYYQFAIYSYFLQGDAEDTEIHGEEKSKQGIENAQLNFKL